MMITEDIENELEVLKSIYGYEYIEKPSVWKRPCFCINLKPMGSINSGGVYVKATVKFTLVINYPKVSPKIEIESSNGLSEKDVLKLLQLLEMKAKQLHNSAMCHDLITIAINFLDENNTKPLSVYDEMINREKREQEILQTLRNSSDDNKTNLIDNKIKITTNELTNVQKNTNIQMSLVNPSVLINNNKNIDKQNVNPSSLIHENPKSSILAGGRTKTWLQQFIDQDDEDEEEDYDDEVEDKIIEISNKKQSMINNNNDNNSIDLLFSSNTNHGLGLGLGRLDHLVGNNFQQSRYLQEFVEISQLGKGASGEVWKARNKLDRRVYAVKKIDLNSTDNAIAGRNKIRREVTTISRLLHKHVVRYFAAWVEEYETQNINNTNNTSSHNNTSNTNDTSGSNSYSYHTESDDILLNTTTTNIDKNNNSSSIIELKTSQLDSYWSNNEKVHININHNSSNEEEDENEDNDLITNKIIKKSSYSRFFHYNSSSSDEDDEEDEDTDDILGNCDMSDEDNSNSISFDLDFQSTSSNTNHVSKESINNNALVNENQSISYKDNLNHTKPNIILKSKLKRLLFIQMEYCYTTLREFIDIGELWQQPCEIVKLFRQLLEALVYIHDRGVIHRDLKPANIFLDAEGNVKIGDFGLATFREIDSKNNIPIKNNNTNSNNTSTNNTTTTTTIEDLNISHPVKSNVLIEDKLESSNCNTFISNCDQLLLSETLTGGIGTAMYRAPEQEMKDNDRKKRNYNEKADMYSIGIILFEMCHQPFSTGMERLIILRKLREHSELPSGFNKDPHTENMGNIIKWLIQHDPLNRPSALQLLSSSMLPARVDTDSLYLKEITEALRKPNSTTSTTIISALFEHAKHAITKTTTVVDHQYHHSSSFMYDIDVLKSNILLLQPRLRSNTATITSFHHKQTKNILNNEYINSNNNYLYEDKTVITLKYKLTLKKELIQVFQSHGAIDFSPHYIQLRSDPIFTSSSSDMFYDHNDSIPSSYVQYLDISGQIIMLPSDLILPFAKLAAFSNIQNSKRYAIDRIYSLTNSNKIKNPLYHSENNANIISNITDIIHPYITEESIFDIILPYAEDPDLYENSKLHADIELLTTSIEVVRRFQPYLPDCAIRISDSRIMDAILDICAWKNIDITYNNKQYNKAKQLHNNNQLTMNEKEQLLKVISLGADGILNNNEINDIIKEVTSGFKVNSIFIKRLLPFLNILCCSIYNTATTTTNNNINDTSLNNTPDNKYLQMNYMKDPLQLLDLLEQEFYKCDVIAEVQRQLASGIPITTTNIPIPIVLSKIPIQNTSIISNNLIRKEDVMHKDNSLKVINDFKQIDINHIGIKTKKKFIEKTINKINERDYTTTTTTTNNNNNKQEDEIIELQVRKRIKSIIKSFDAAVNHLRKVIKTALPTLYDQPLRYNNNNNILSFPGISSLLVIIDLGKDPRYLSSSSSSVGIINRNTTTTTTNATNSSNNRMIYQPFHEHGMYFIIETYLFPSEQYLQQLKLILKEHYKEHHQLQHTTSTSTSSMEIETLLKCVRRRQKGSNGVIGEAGHYHHMIKSYQTYFNQDNYNSNNNIYNNNATNSSSNTTTNNSLIACALRIKLDYIIDLIIKYETRQSKIQHMLQSKNTNIINQLTKFHFIERFKTDLSCLLYNDIDILIIDQTTISNLLLDNHHAEDLLVYHEPTMMNPLIYRILSMLRSFHIKVIDRLHQLMGMDKNNMFINKSMHLDIICKQYSIQYVCLVKSEMNFIIKHVSSINKSKDQLQEHFQDIVVTSITRLPYTILNVLGKHNNIDKIIFNNNNNNTTTNNNNMMMIDSSYNYQNNNMEVSYIGALNTTNSYKTNTRLRVNSFDKNVSCLVDNNNNSNNNSNNNNNSFEMNQNSSVQRKTTTSTTDIRLISIIILDNISHHNNSNNSSNISTSDNKQGYQYYNHPKDKKIAILKKKDIEQIPQRIINHMKYKYTYLLNNDNNNNIKLNTILRSMSSPYMDGMVIAIDVSFLLIRNVITIFMSRLTSTNNNTNTNNNTSNMVKEEFESLLSSNYTSNNDKKQIKSLITQLYIYSKQIINNNSNNIDTLSQSLNVTTKKISNNSTSISATNNSINSNINNSSSNIKLLILQLHIYSIIDDQMDLLSCDAKLLLDSKLL